MSSDRINNTRQACLRCRTQKRKCDKAFPRCLLCKRLGRACLYDATPPPSIASPALTEQSLSTLPAPWTLLTESRIKAAIVQNFSGTTPEEVATAFYRSVHTWFPIISFPALCERLPRTWDDASTDLSLVFMSMSLLTEAPGVQEEPRKPGIPRALESSYLSTRSWIAVSEGLGLCSLDFLHARLLIVLFEVVHGIFPAASISIGALFRATDVLVCGQDHKQEYHQTWRGMLILDRYISIESKYWPSVSRNRSFDFLQTHSPLLEMPSPTPYAFSRLFQASGILSDIQKAVFEQTPDISFITDKFPSLLNILDPFRNTLVQEVPQELKVYSSSWAIFSIGLLLLHESNVEADPINLDKGPCLLSSQEHKDELLLEIFEVVRPFVEDEAILNTQLLPPFITHLVYKGAEILTEKLRIGNFSPQCIRMLRSMRNFLKLISERWVAAEHALFSLDEDTTPRMARVLE